MFSSGRRWTLYRGAQTNDSAIVGVFDKGQSHTADGVKALLTGSKGAEIALQQTSSGWWAMLCGKEECELTFQGQVVAKVQQLSLSFLLTTLNPYLTLNSSWLISIRATPGIHASYCYNHDT